MTRKGAKPDERTDARERAMMLLYEADNRRIPLIEVVDAQITEIDPLARELAEGVDVHRQALDAAIAAQARGWTIARMPAIDRTVLRIAAYELAHRPEVPTAVILNEAVTLANSYSTDDSGRFVNGVLASVAKVLRR
ncbi:MAG TPA: transcription antitermination factor NusB [Ilumatobacteraceae bacterium]|nr:transcription antitermination factor NusB [Ilumatobacteraceae bacterium]